MKLSKQGADFIKSFEGCRLEAYHGAAESMPEHFEQDRQAMAEDTK